MKLRYIVSIEYYTFEFDTPEEAIDFATKAKLHTSGRRHIDDDVEVRIDIKVEKENEETEDE